MVVGDDDERPSLVRVESDRPVDRHLQVVLELSAENRMIKTSRHDRVHQAILPLSFHQAELTPVGREEEILLPGTPEGSGDGSLAGFVCEV